MKMELNLLSDDELHEKTLAAARSERQATLLFLEFLAAIDERRLFNARGYSSLWEYVHKALGLSEAQAYERVAAMRLIRKIPEVRAEIAANRMSLTATAKLAAFVKRERCTMDETTQLLAQVSDKSTREVDRILAAAQSVPEHREDTIRSAGPETVRVAFDADPEFLGLFERVKEVQGRYDWSMNDRLKAALKEYLADRELKLKFPKAKPSEEFSGNSGSPREPSSKVASVKSRASRYISQGVRRQVRERSGDQCEYRDSGSGRRCESRFDLEFDHIRPFALGGFSTLENIRHLCASHNHWAAIQIFGDAISEARQ
jgi:hypothetical protein